MTWRACLVTALALGGAAGCGLGDASAEKVEIPTDVASYVLSQAPSDLPNPTLLDFGALQIIGYSVQPSQLAAPGSSLNVKLFWRCVSKLAPGYELFTSLVTPAGTRTDFAAAGPLRKGTLPLSAWEPGKLYIDELELRVPADIDAARFSIVAGVVHPAPVPVEAAEAKGEKVDENAGKADAKAEAPAAFSPIRLQVLSGPSDGKSGGIIATLETGVTAASKAARAAAAEQPRKRMLQPGKAPMKRKIPSAPKPLGAAPVQPK